MPVVQMIWSKLIEYGPGNIAYIIGHIAATYAKVVFEVRDIRDEG